MQFNNSNDSNPDVSAHLDNLAFQFFKLFAQSEYALKAMGYGRAGKADVAEPDWDRFANEIGVLLLQEKGNEIADAVTYLLEHPPKRQVWTENGVAWNTVQNNERSPQILFAHIRRVRNNLYHGGKFGGRWLDPDRSKELISKSLMILEHLVVSNPDLREAIQGNTLT